jgi:hypothetical protein
MASSNSIIQRQASNIFIEFERVETEYNYKLNDFLSKGVSSFLNLFKIFLKKSKFISNIFEIKKSLLMTFKFSSSDI